MTARAPRLLAAGVLAALVALALPACRGARPVEGRPSPRAGWSVYALRDLRFQAPAAWQATGDERRVALEAPGGSARLEVSVPGTPFADERACLASADQKLAERQATLDRAQRHPTTFAGKSGHKLEADQRGWMIWAVAACDGGVQYRIFFTAASPASPEALDVLQTLRTSARIGGEA